MWLALLAAAAASSQAGAAPAPAPVVVVKAPAAVAAKVDVSSDSDTADYTLVTVWPLGAFQSKINGEVKLSCLVDVYGLAESCHVLSESPEGKGFGAAAMELRPTFKLTPKQGPSGPVATDVTIALHFTAPDPQFGIGGSGGGGVPSAEGATQNIAAGIQVSNPLNMRAVTMLDNPVWAQAASFADLEQARPTKAGDAEGYAVAHCHVLRIGFLTNCQVIKETPDKLGFGAAAVSLAAKFRVAAEWTTPPHHAELWVDLPVRFPPPGSTGERAVTSPKWLVGVDPDTAPEVFPPEAAAKGLTTGAGIARCVVAADGSLTTCTPEPGDPDGLGFSEAAVKLAAVMKMNPWSSDAAPVDGAVVRVRVELNLKAQ